MQTWEKPIGTVGLSFGTVRVYATSAQLYEWSHTPGAVWPCSELDDCERVCAELASNGDLVDLIVTKSGVRFDDTDLPGDELTAWIDDNLAGTPFAHLAKNAA